MALGNPWLVVVVLGMVGCASSGGAPARTLPMPSAEGRNQVLDDLGRRAFGALQRHDGEALLLGDRALHLLLHPSAASTAAVLRAAPAPDDGGTGGQPLEGCRYSGVCVQRARTEPAGGTLGLREPGFAVDRVLVACREPGGGRIAAWVEGTFILTDRGFYAIALQRLESPRRDHADLDLAPCDFRVEAGEAQPVVVSGAESH